MNNDFLKELSHKPIMNTFKLAYKMLLSNKILFFLVSIIFILLSSAPLLIPFSIGKISIVLILSISVIISIVSQIFTVSNYLYICKMLLQSNNREEFLDKMILVKLSSIFFNYFTRALGSSLAIIIIVAPFILMQKELYLGEYYDNFLILLLALAVYVYAIVSYKITLSKSFKEAFIVTFTLFSPSVWKQSFNITYAKFVISLALILWGIYYAIGYILDNLSLDFTFMAISIITSLMITVFSIFVALFILPIAMVIAQNISASDC